MKYSHNNEQDYIDSILKRLDLNNTYVDIGASDGIEMSNTLFLAQRGWNGLCVEYNSSKYASLVNNYKQFTKIKFSNEKVTPFSVCEILRKTDNPKKFDVLNLDIDGYDYFVLEALLKGEYRPTLICAEINEKIPPPIKFTVLYDDAYSWTDAPFFGQSIEQVQMLCTTYDYSILNVEYNNVFLIDNKVDHKLSTMSSKEAWTQGYFNKPDRTTRFSFNNGFEPIYSMTPEDAINFINRAYGRHVGRYSISL